jgi:hypothetical protein
MNKIIDSITPYGYRHLSVDDIERLESLIGTVVEESEEVAEIDGKYLLRCVDNEVIHPDFVNLKSI